MDLGLSRRIERSRLLVQNQTLPGWAVPAALLVVVVLAYGAWIPRLGLYGNDVPYVYYYHLLGPWGPGMFASIDRPASAVFYAAVTSLLGESVWSYHVFLLALRWLGAVLLWWVLRLVWPEKGSAAVLAALLFAVYPGFRQNPVSVEFILHFAVLDLFLVSLGAALLSSRDLERYWPLAAASAVGTAGLFWLEYFIGLEVLRPIFLWIVTRRLGLTGREQWKRILRAWLPALIVVAAFLVWRVAIFSFPTYKPVLLDQLRQSPLNTLLDLVKRAAGDLFTSLVGAWRQVLALPGGRERVTFIALVLGSFALTCLFFAWLRRHNSLDQQTLEDGRKLVPGNRFWGETVLGIGLLAMLFSGVPFWLTGIPLSLDFPWDRTSLAFLVGATLALTGLIDMVIAPRYQPVIAAGLVSLAIGMHFVNAVAYEQEWSKLRDFFWQLTWRAPGLQAGTLGLFDVIPLNRYSDNDLTALLNWTYAPDHHDARIPYKFFDLTIRLGDTHVGLPGLKKGLPVEHNHRGLFFKTTTSNTLAVHYNPPGCLKLLRPQDGALPGVPDRLAKALPITSLDQVETRAAKAARPPAVLGAEPKDGWCYFFEKADLARQRGDWKTAAGLGGVAESDNLQPGDPVERLPFIEAYARVGEWAQAKAWSEKVNTGSMHPALCALWQNLSADLGRDAANIQAALGCVQ